MILQINYIILYQTIELKFTINLWTKQVVVN